ncbi:MAG: hypothetical protein B7Z54_00420 [Sphingobacteriales bacterium 12-47-4]|nr:MAG: hypothetical protein B7Z54_00420 [Sphingobacteriales bacterium 12-47-4]
MERSNRITALIYSYAVCLVAIITFLFSSLTLVNSLIDRQDLMRSGWTPAGSPSLASFENYKMDVAAKLQRDDSLFRARFFPTEKEMRAMFDSAKEDKYLSNKHSNNKNLLIGVVLVIISSLLFATHWAWAKKLTRQSEG